MYAPLACFADDLIDFSTHKQTNKQHTLCCSRAPSFYNSQQTRFQQMSDSIIGRIDEMGSRIDDLEKSIGDLIQQAGLEEVDMGSQKPPAKA